MGAGKSYRAPATSSPPATPAATAGTKDSELVKQIAALIVPEMTSSSEERLKKNAQREFWTEMRERLSVNQSSSGLFVLDQLAAFTDPVMLLPKPARQREAPNAYVHNRFSNTQDLPDVNVNSAPVIFGKGTPPAKIPSPAKLQKKKKKSPTKEAATEALLALGRGKPSSKGAKPVTPPSTLGKRKQTSKSDDEQKIKFPKPIPTPTPETDYCPVEYELQEKMDKNEYDLPKIPPLRVNEEGHPGYTPIKHRDGTFTALQAAPLEKPIDDRDSDSFEPDTSDEDEVEVVEPKTASAPKFA
eukprot:jgi/Phyca11/15844/fgenesh1_pg.PHYCAscaffold_16_\